MTRLQAKIRAKERDACERIEDPLLSVCEHQICVHCLMDSISEGGGDGCDCGKVVDWISSCRLSLNVSDLSRLLSDSELDA